MAIENISLFIMSIILNQIFIGTALEKQRQTDIEI